MNFLEFQNNIKTYIQENLPDVLTSAGLDDFDAYIDDFLDLDKYQKSKQFFYNFGAYSYDDLTNQSESQTFDFSIYMVFQNANSTTSKELMLKYAAAFYKMFDDSGRNLGGLCDIGKIQNVDFYNAAEGSEDVKVCELTIQLISEV